MIDTSDRSDEMAFGHKPEVIDPYRYNYIQGFCRHQPTVDYGMVCPECKKILAGTWNQYMVRREGNSAGVRLGKRYEGQKAIVVLKDE